MNWIDALPMNWRAGSRPRCLLFTDGSRVEVAARLQALVALPDVTVTAADTWTPRGLPIRRQDGSWDLRPTREAKLGEKASFLDALQRETVTKWWLASVGKANTPNWDVVSTCSISGKKGLLLVEAKAHREELEHEAGPKPSPKKSSEGSRANHEKIRGAIALARDGLRQATALPWEIDRDTHYQMSNRFAWAWKVATFGWSVVLIYLGFLDAEEMRSPVRHPLGSCAEWEQAVKSHSAALFPPEVWGREWSVGGQRLFALIRSLEQPLATSIAPRL